MLKNNRSNITPILIIFLPLPFSGSTDSLLEEANNFLDIAKNRFVTSEDWIEIKSKKNSPSIRDLKIQDQIQFIGQDLELQDGQIVNVIPEDQLVHVAV